MKRGQITTYLLIGLLLFFIITAIIYLKTYFTQRSQASEIEASIAISPQVQPIRDSLQECIQTTLIDALRLVGLHGGYLATPEPFLKTTLSTVAYWFYNGKDTKPKLKKIEEEISTYLQIAVPFCITDELFPGFTFSRGEVSATTTIKKDIVSTSVSYPVTASKDNTQYTLPKKYTVSVRVRLGYMYSVAEGIIVNAKKRPDALDISYLADSSYNIGVYPQQDRIFLYVLTDKTMPLQETPYTLLFAYYQLQQ